MNDLIFVALSTFAADDKAPLELLKNSGFPYKTHTSGKRITKEELLRDGTEASVIVGGVEPYSAEVLSALGKLRCISRCGVGVDAIDLKYAREKGISVMNTPMVPVTAVAELAITMMLSLSRNIVTQTNLMYERKWERVSSHLLSGRVVGIIGFGRIGQRVVQLCKAFDANVIVHDPYAEQRVDRFPGTRFVSKHELLEQADIVSIHASKSADAPVIIGKAEFDVMKQGSLLINLSRGEMVEEQALVSALASGRLAGAGLDVFEQEPYSGPLCDFRQVILTPHSATLPLETRVEMEIQCIENAISFLRGTVNTDRLVI